MTLENLYKINQLKQEPADKKEFEGLFTAANERLADAQNPSLSYSSRFDLAYNAAHGFSLAALRAKGYRSDKRYLVFQCLEHTSELSKVQIRLFAKCHEKRNRAEYEGYFDADEQLLKELVGRKYKVVKAAGRGYRLVMVIRDDSYLSEVIAKSGCFLHNPLRIKINKSL